MARFGNAVIKRQPGIEPIAAGSGGEFGAVTPVPKKASVILKAPSPRGPSRMPATINPDRILHYFLQPHSFCGVDDRLPRSGTAGDLFERTRRIRQTNRPSAGGPLYSCLSAGQPDGRASSSLAGVLSANPRGRQPTTAPSSCGSGMPATALAERNANPQYMSPFTISNGCPPVGSIEMMRAGAASTTPR